MSSRSCSVVSPSVSVSRCTVVTPVVHRVLVNQSVWSRGTSGSPVRHVVTRGTEHDALARCASRSRVLRSAQWQSSTCSATGRTAASARSSRLTADRSRAAPHGSSGVGLDATSSSGSRRVRLEPTYAGHARSASSTHCLLSVSLSVRRASMTGRRGTSRDRCRQWPTTTVVVVDAAAAPTSAVLPTPASPVTRSSPVPASRCCRTTSSSATRPAITTPGRRGASGGADAASHSS